MEELELRAIKEEIQAMLEVYVRGVRQYNPYSLSSLIIEKKWNGGRGSLALFRFYPDKKTILVNKELYNRFDEKHLREIIKILMADEWKIVYVYYGYPDYYNKSFNLNLKAVG